MVDNLIELLTKSKQKQISERRNERTSRQKLTQQSKQYCIVEKEKAQDYPPKQSHGY